VSEKERERERERELKGSIKVLEPVNEKMTKEIFLKYFLVEMF
jgi:hypothetical protein